MRADVVRGRWVLAQEDLSHTPLLFPVHSVGTPVIAGKELLFGLSAKSLQRTVSSKDWYVSLRTYVHKRYGSTYLWAPILSAPRATHPAAHVLSVSF